MNAVTPSAWDEAMKAMTQALTTPLGTAKTRTFDPMAVAGAMNDFAFRMAARPDTLISASIQGAQQWTDFWMKAMTPGADTAATKKRDRRFSSRTWEED